MTPEDLDYIGLLVKDRSGLVLGRDKAYLVESRLAAVARSRQLDGLAGLVAALRTRRDGGLLTDVVEALTTHETSFFRDLKPFDAFRDSILPRIIENRRQRKCLRIWCAACSSGQEPYSLAILLTEMSATLTGWRVEIIGTDISALVLDRARRGVYSQFEVQRGMPPGLLAKYFRRVGAEWEVVDKVRSAVTFKQLNLLSEISSIGSVDAVFCRNVLIYFDAPTRERVIAGIEGVLEPDGVLFLGGAESTVGIHTSLKSVPWVRGAYARAGHFDACAATGPALVATF
ncbi:MAG: protein-glutamate O-methyltransferase CheR [Rhodospirillales bacterium]|nr:protein-glutamate O-methyltransferase CheR [Rhodospirillales bacterium]